ncbi:TetR/AcrR family transcriptional regulator [Actinomadura syzygii]|uniref:TetR/AcrR family transcriptional regulator n=1 Tax=Actinomadura syzygii TaxID=1427538 RepID=A0A5D0UBU3_9ACTN|nr:TetR/AcrR family transcriptional regulator [Actinomadura syzygii]TYC15105.1 TetR/AcrR family transcriptional regulator [Actinomadura syzygii]
MTAVDALLAPGGTRLRADARRNAERLVAAARAALDEQGLEITTRDVAQRAGVGLGTLYRRVPSLDALLSAILIDTITEMTELALRARAADDPWTAFVDFAESYVRLRASSCGLHDALSGACDLDLDPHIDRLRQEVRHLVARAQDAGAIRDDLDWSDVPFVLATAIPSDHTIGLSAKPDQWRRNLGIILDGLRPSPSMGSE